MELEWISRAQVGSAETARGSFEEPKFHTRSNITHLMWPIRTKDGVHRPDDESEGKS